MKSKMFFIPAALVFGAFSSVHAEGEKREGYTEIFMNDGNPRECQWIIKGGNGKTVASGESYSNKNECAKGIDSLRRAMKGVDPIICIRDRDYELFRNTKSMSEYPRCSER